MSPILAVISSLALASSFSAAATCPQLVPGASYPWQKEEIVPGDQYATIFIDVDAKGRSTNCRVGANNLPDSETRFWVCRAMMSEGQIVAEVRNGVPVASTVTRSMVMRGRQYEREDDAARKRYFATHPDQNSTCYPQ